MVSRSSFSRNSRLSSGALTIVIALRGRSFCRDSLDDGVDHRLRGLAVGMGVEIEYDAVAQDRRRDRLYILDGEMKASFDQSPHASALDQGLRAARGAAVPYVLPGQLVRFALLRLSRQ